MTQPRFREHDRKEVVCELEKVLGITLRPVPRYKKFFRGNDNKTYWILGGTGDWHGLPADAFKPLSSGEDGRVLVVARLLRDRVILFCAPMERLIRNKHKLTYARSSSGGQYQIDLVYKGNDDCYVKQLPDYWLKKIHQFKYGTREEEIEAEIRAMSPGEKERLIKMIKKKSKG